MPDWVNARRGSRTNVRLLVGGLFHVAPPALTRADYGRATEPAVFGWKVGFNISLVNVSLGSRLSVALTYKSVSLYIYATMYAPNRPRKSSTHHSPRDVGRAWILVDFRSGASSSLSSPCCPANRPARRPRPPPPLPSSSAHEARLPQ